MSNPDLANMESGIPDVADTESEPKHVDSEALAIGTPSMRKRGKFGIWATYIASVIFLYGLPIWSRLFMDGFGGKWQAFCWTPAEQITCGDGQNYTEIAIRLNRIVDGKYYGCACGEGIFRDYVCPVSADRLAQHTGQTETFSISYFISTAPGTGAMAAFTVWPQLAMWFYGVGHPELIEQRLGLELLPNEFCYRKFLRWTLVLFQFCYGLFLINTTCVSPKFHAYSVVAFLFSAVLHFLAVSWRVGRQHKLACVIQVMVWTAVASIAVGILYPVSPSWLGTHAFFLAEATGLAVGFGIAPVLSLAK